MVRNIMCRYNLPKYLWGKAIKTTFYILNRGLSKLVLKTPFKLWTRWKPSLRHVRIWGWPSEVKTVQWYFIGYPEHSKGYKFHYTSCNTRVVKSLTTKFLELDSKWSHY